VKWNLYVAHFSLKICTDWIFEGRGKAPVICKNRDVATVFYASKSYKTFKVSGAGHEPEKTFFHFVSPHCVTVFDSSKKKNTRSVGRGPCVAAAGSARLTTTRQPNFKTQILRYCAFLHVHNEHMVGKGAYRKQLDGILLNLQIATTLLFGQDSGEKEE
jgi:hypothetical protein